MRIAINHLTRMQAGFVCVAGLDLATGRHVRPVLRKQLRTSWLSCQGGPFEIAAVIDLGRTKRIGKPPELEDTLFRADEARAIGALDADDFWALLDRSARSSLKDLFGPDLQRRGSWSCVLPVHHGHASLGLYRPVAPHLFVEKHAGRSRIRMRFRSGHCQFRAPVTDIRLYREDHVTPHIERVRQVNTLLAEGREIVLSVGLSRRFKKAAADPALHWLQINNLHFADKPVWTLIPRMPAASSFAVR